MKRFFTILGASLAGFCGMLSADAPQNTESEVTITTPQIEAGLSFVGSVREDVLSGAYEKFFKDADKRYKENMKKHAYDSFLEARRETGNVATSLAQAESAKGVDMFAKKCADLLQKRDQKLSEIVRSHETDPLAVSLKNSLFFEFSDEQKDALDYYFDLHAKLKEKSTSPLESELIRIDTEFWLKQRDLDTMHIQHKVSDREYARYSLALEIKKLEEMKTCALKESDSKLSEKVLTFFASFPTHAAIVHDQKLLSQLADEKIAATTPLHEKVKSVMQEYVNERSTLTAHYFPETTK